MQGVIKGMLKEELQNSLRMKKEYEIMLRKLQKGCIVEKKIGQNAYYYLVKRINKKVKYLYLGKLSKGDIKKYNETKILRAKYRNLLSKVKRQIKYLRGTLRGKEAI